MSQEEHYKTYDTLFEPLLIVDKKGKIEYFNHHFPTFSQLPPRKINKTTKFSDLFECPDLEIDKFFKEAIKKDTPTLSEEIQLKFTHLPTVKYHVVIKVFPYPDDQKKFVVTFNDMSVEKNLFEKYRTNMQELKDSHSQIVQADKLSTIGELTASISHEINNPLTIAMGNIEVLETLMESAEETKENFDTITTSVKDIDESLQRIKEIIHNMKGFLHKSEDKKSYVYMKELIEESHKLIKPAIEDSKVVIKTDIKDENIISLVNRSKILQVLVNLMKNALDALIEARTETPSISISLSSETENNSILLKVRDNGPGIPDDIIEEVFNPFFTTKEIGVGTGLGLPICKKIIDAHHGELSVNSDGKSYTEFVISLPALEISTLAENDKSYFSNDKSRSQKIMVIDNEPQILNILNNFFDAEGHTFIGSTNGEEALKLYDRMNIDLIITDYSMPGMNGTEFITKVREKDQSIPVLYMTGKRNFEQFKKDQGPLNVSGLLMKPFTKDDVIKIIKTALGEK